MLPSVAIDVPSDLGPAVAQTVVSRCERVLGAGRCRIAAPDQVAGDVAYYAFVRTGDAEQLTFEIEFRSRSSAGTLLTRRRLEFSDRDAAESRWASAGLVVAGLVAAQPPLAPRRPLAKAAKAPKPPARLHAPPRTWDTWGLDVGVLTGPGLREGRYRRGAFARGWLTLPGAPALMAATTFHYASTFQEPALRWVTASAGLGARLGHSDSPLNAELIGELVVERLFITATEPASQRQESGGQARLGGRIGVNTAIHLWKGLRLVVGADASTLTPPVNIEISSVSVGHEPSGRFAFTGGLRFAF